MRQQDWKVEFYQRPNGRRPAKEFLDDLAYDERERMIRQMGRLKRWGPQLRRPDSGYLRDKIHELRAEWQGVQLRILYFRDDEHFFLTNGLRKKTNRVPESDINRAVDYRREYFAHKRGE